MPSATGLAPFTDCLQETLEQYRPDAERIALQILRAKGDAIKDWSPEDVGMLKQTYRNIVFGKAGPNEPFHPLVEWTDVFWLIDALGVVPITDAPAALELLTHTYLRAFNLNYKDGRGHNTGLQFSNSSKRALVRDVESLGIDGRDILRFMQYVIMTMTVKYFRPMSDRQYEKKMRKKSRRKGMPTPRTAG